jgi:glycosidase
LKRLVSECHDRGIHVIMDGVFNHVSYDFPTRSSIRTPPTAPSPGHPSVERLGLQDLDFGQPITES